MPRELLTVSGVLLAVVGLALANSGSVWAGRALFVAGIVILIIAKNMNADRASREARQQGNSPRKPIALSIDDEAQPYYRFAGDFWRATETIAMQMTRREGTGAVTAESLGGGRCRMEFVFEANERLPENLKLGGGLTLAADGRSARFETSKAMRFASPGLARRMIVREMTAEPGSDVKTRLLESNLVGDGDQARIVCRFAVIYDP